MSTLWICKIHVYIVKHKYVFWKPHAGFEFDFQFLKINNMLRICVFGSQNTNAVFKIQMWFLKYKYDYLKYKYGFNR